MLAPTLRMVFTTDWRVVAQVSMLKLSPYGCAATRQSNYLFRSVPILTSFIRPKMMLSRLLYFVAL